MKSIQISPVDLCFINGRYPIEFVIFYPYPIDGKSLKKVIKKCVSYFWPAFGEYKNGNITPLPLHEEDWWVEESKDSIFDPSKKYENIHHEFGTDYLKALQFAKDGQIPSRLCQFKLIHFQNGAMFIPSLNHLAGDGYSYFYFLSVIAAIYRKRRIPLAGAIIKQLTKPRMIRKIGQDFQVPQEKLAGYFPEEELVVDLIEFNKKKARQLAEEASKNSGLAVSTNDVLCALEVQTIFKNRSSMNISDFNLVIPIDVRRRIPEYGKKFFGNGLMFYKVQFNTEKTKMSSLEDIAIHIRKSFPEVNHNSLDEFNEKLIRLSDIKQYEALIPYNPQNDCLVTNLSRIPIHGLDLGKGSPSFIAPTTIGKGATLIIAKKENFILRRVRNKRN